MTAALLVTVPAFAQGPAAAPAASSQANVNAEVKRLFEEGQLAAGFAQWEKARTAFGKAFALKPLPQIALNLGRAEVKVGEALSGAEHLQFFLREETNPDPAEVAAAQALIKQAKPKIVMVTMKVEPADAEVLVDGRLIEKKLLPGPIFLPPGTHSFEAKKDGFQGASQSLELSAGAEVGVPLKLVDFWNQILCGEALWTNALMTSHVE